MVLYIYMLEAGLVAVDLPREKAFLHIIGTLEKINAKVRNADRTAYLIEGRSATAMTGFNFPFEIRLKPYLERNTLVEVLAPLDKQFVNSFMKEFTKIVTPIREPVIIELVSIKEVERQIEQNEIAFKSKEAGK